MRIRLGELDTFYEADGDGPPLVLLHPGLADARAFERNVPGVAEHHRVPPLRALVMVGDGDREIPIAHTPAPGNRIVIDFLEEQP